MRILSIILACMVCLTVAAAVGRADSAPTVSATLSVGPADIVTLSDPDITNPALYSGQVYAGELVWTPASPAAQFVTYCIDIKSDITPGGKYTYDIYSLGSSPTGNGSDGKNLTVTQTTDIELLWGKYYNSIIVANDAQGNADRAAAFQIDIWKIIYGNDLTVTAVGNDGWLTNTNLSPWINDPNTWLTTNRDTDLGTNSVPLAALDSASAQDQTTDSFVGSLNPNISAVPIPSSFAGGILLCAGMAGVVRIRKAMR
jgi:hypothetical protein